MGHRCRVARSCHTHQCLSHIPLFTKEVNNSVRYSCKVARSCCTHQFLFNIPLLNKEVNNSVSYRVTTMQYALHNILFLFI